MIRIDNTIQYSKIFKKFWQKRNNDIRKAFRVKFNRPSYGNVFTMIHRHFNTLFNFSYYNPKYNYYHENIHILSNHVSNQLYVLVKFKNSTIAKMVKNRFAYQFFIKFHNNNIFSSFLVLKIWHKEKDQNRYPFSIVVTEYFHHFNHWTTVAKSFWG